MSRARCRISCYGRLAVDLESCQLKMMAVGKRGIVRPPAVRSPGMPPSKMGRLLASVGGGWAPRAVAPQTTSDHCLNRWLSPRTLTDVSCSSLQKSHIQPSCPTTTVRLDFSACSNPNLSVPPHGTVTPIVLR